nr:vegetative cell wall protein gp1-like [Arachis hypogaea]
MGKKVIAKRAPREKIHKLPGYPRPSTRSQDTTFTPSPSPPTSPPRTSPMAQTKTTPRYPASAKPTPPPKATPSKPASSKPGSSKPSSSKGKRPATEEPVPEPTKPKSRSVPVRSQRGSVHSYVKGRDIILNNETISDSLKYTDVRPCAYTSVKWDEGVDIATDVDEEDASEGNGSDAYDLSHKNCCGCSFSYAVAAVMIGNTGLNMCCWLYRIP